MRILPDMSGVKQDFVFSVTGEMFYILLPLISGTLAFKYYAHGRFGYLRRKVNTKHEYHTQKALYLFAPDGSFF